MKYLKLTIIGIMIITLSILMLIGNVNATTIDNGNFESGVLTPWWTWKQFTGVTAPNISTESVNSGTYSVKFAADSGTYWLIMSNLDLTGHSTISWYEYCPTAGKAGSAYLNDAGGDSNTAFNYYSLANSWTERTMTIPAAYKKAGVMFKIMASGSAITYYDDFEIDGISFSKWLINATVKDTNNNVNVSGVNVIVEYSENGNDYANGTTDANGTVSIDVTGMVNGTYQLNTSHPLLQAGITQFFMQDDFEVVGSNHVLTITLERGTLVKEMYINAIDENTNALLKPVNFTLVNVNASNYTVSFSQANGMLDYNFTQSHTYYVTTNVSGYLNHTEIFNFTSVTTNKDVRTVLMSTGTDTTTEYGICGFIYDLQDNTKLGGVTLYLKNSSNIIINKTTSTNSGFYYFPIRFGNTSEIDGDGLAKNNFNVTAQLSTYNNATSDTWHWTNDFEFLYGESLSPYGDISMNKTLSSGNASFVFRVYDYYSGYGIGQATCEIYNASTGTLFKNGTTSTNIDTYGICFIGDIPVGSWQLKVYKGGYTTFYTPYTTEANRTYNIDVLLATSGVPTVSPNPTLQPTITPTGTPSGNPSDNPLPTGTDEGWNYIFDSIGINVDAVTMNMIFGLIIIVFLIGIVITVTTSDNTGISSKATIPAIAVMALLGLVFNCITGLWPFWILPVFAIICVIGGIWYLFGSNSGG